MHAIVAERGQVTIPKRLRDRLGLTANSVVDFEEDGGRLILRKVVQDDPVSRVRGCLTLRHGTDALIRELRGET